MPSIASKKNSNAPQRSKRRTLLDPNIAFQVTEAYKNLRTNLTFALSTKQNKIIAVSSSLASEGKSTVAANIAITLAQTSSKVLLVDCDLRKPVQHKIFKVKNTKGLSTLMGGIHSFKEVVNEQVIDSLDVVTCGPIPPNPSEMLASDNMKVLLEELSKYYDYIILDTPPINVVTDALTLVNSIAGILLVAKQGQSTYDALGEAIDAIKFANGSILGVVVNNVNITGGKYNYKNKYKYKYNYAYGENASTQSLKDK
ncbi:MAG: CpsD/CapB family tyrosine-protein kinase [Ruminococcus sp.]|nr:CpsD/CapB family tyrosine-protein kinase [Ruminococcus sp.]